MDWIVARQRFVVHSQPHNGVTDRNLCYSADAFTNPDRHEMLLDRIPRGNSWSSANLSSYADEPQSGSRKAKLRWCSGQVLCSLQARGPLWLSKVVCSKPVIVTACLIRGCPDRVSRQALGISRPVTGCQCDGLCRRPWQWSGPSTQSTPYAGSAACSKE